jgi:hypothetical protein
VTVAAKHSLLPAHAAAVVALRDLFLSVCLRVLLVALLLALHCQRWATHTHTRFLLAAAAAAARRL